MSADELVLAIDLGSTWCKAACVDRTGKIVGHAESWVRDERPFGHDEAALNRIWQGVLETVRAATSQAGRTRPAALAVTARKAPGIWLDGPGRAVGIPEELVASAGRAEIEACYASPVWGDDDPFAYGYGLDLIGNTRWLMRNHPERWARLRHVGNLHSWLVYRLTGRWATSHAGGPVQAAWPEAVRILTGLPPELYPTVIPDAQVIGQLHPRVAAELGFPPETPVVTGTHDGAAANIGAGVLEPGDACLTFGTNGVLRVVTGERLPRRFGYTITAGRWALVRDLPNLAPRLDDVAAALIDTSEQVTPEQHTELSSQAASVPIGSHGLRLGLFPDSAGLTVAQARAEGHDSAVTYRAALEAVALGFAGLVRKANEAGAHPGRYVATGGGSDNDLLLRITSAAIGAPIERPEAEAGLLGVAMLAATGAGWFDDVFAAADAMRSKADAVEASVDERAAYAEIMRSTRLPSGTAPGDVLAA